MNINKIFKVTYFVAFEDEDKNKHDYFQRFWIWKSPEMFYWLYENRARYQKQLRKDLMITYCNKF